MKKSANSRTEVVLPSSVICKFLNQDGIDAGSPVEMPVEATTKQLEVLLNTLLGNADQVRCSLSCDLNSFLFQLPYAFYVNGTEVVSSLSDSLNQMIAESADSVSFEDYLNISYQPLSVYRVRPVSRCVETMPGHTDAVLHVSYSPDGKRLASGGGDLAVRFWDVTTSMPLHTCLGHSHHVLCTIWAPDGSVFVSADRSGEIRLWNPTNGLQRGRAMKGHSKWITSLSFEPFHRDHRCIRLASASKDHTIVIWNLATCTSEAVICGHTDSVECVKWGGSGLIYSCSRDRTIKVWAIDDPGRNQHKLVRTLTGHAHRINSLALNSDYVLRTGPFNLGDRISSVLDLDEDVSGKQTRALERYTTMVGSVGETLVSCSDDFTLFLWKPQESKTPITRMTGWSIPLKI